MNGVAGLWAGVWVIGSVDVDKGVVEEAVGVFVSMSGVSGITRDDGW